jgi:hypothetical protein
MRKIRFYDDALCPYSHLESHELESHWCMATSSGYRWQSRWFRASELSGVSHSRE